MTKSPSEVAGADGCWAPQGIAIKSMAVNAAPKNFLKHLSISHLYAPKSITNEKARLDAHRSNKPLVLMRCCEYTATRHKILGARGRLMRRILLFGLSLVLLPSPSWCQAKPKVSPAVSAFVKEDAAVISLAHVRVVDGTGSAPRVDQTVVIADGKIVALGDSASTKIPDGAKVLDLAGRTVIPGLVGMHDHMFYPAPGGGLPLYPEHASSFPRLYLAGGVTSIRTTGSLEPYADLELKQAIDRGKLAGPKIHVTGPYLEGEGAFALQMHQLKDAEDARQMVEF